MGTTAGVAAVVDIEKRSESRGGIRSGDRNNETSFLALRPPSSTTHKSPLSIKLILFLQHINSPQHVWTW